MKVVLYTIGCPKCNVLEKKMRMKGVQFEVCRDIPTMQELGITSAPRVRVDDGELMDFTKANKWINSLEALNGNN